MILLRKEALTDTAFALTPRTMNQVIRRARRGWGEKFVTGAGATEPQGIKTICSRTAATASNTDVSFDDIVSLMKKVDIGYTGQVQDDDDLREGGGQTGFLMSQDMYWNLFGKKDTNGRPLITASLLEGRMGLTGGAFTNLLGYPFRILKDIDAIGAGKIPLYFGNWSFYGIRTVDSVEVTRYDDSETAKKNSVGIIGFSRRDARAKGSLAGNPAKAEAFAGLLLKA